MMFVLKKISGQAFLFRRKRIRALKRRKVYNKKIDLRTNGGLDIGEVRME